MLDKIARLSFCLIIFYAACKTKQNTNQTKKNLDSLIRTKVGNSNVNRLNKIAEDHSSDSLQLETALNKALAIAKKHQDDLFFATKIGSDSSGTNNIYATLEFGNIFSKDRKHLLVKRFIRNFSVEATLYSNIYLLQNKKFKSLVADIADVGYSSNTLTDVNEDNFPDYIISSYSDAGCCPRDSRVAYLYNNLTGGFYETSFFNPQFDFKNHVFYESEYGHPGEISIDKYQWKGKQKIKIESIYPTYHHYPDSIVKPYTFTKVIYPSEKKIVMKNLPEEYKKLDIYEYFISYQQP